MRALMAALLGLALASSACVTRGTYHEATRERDRLQAENSSLGERVTLLQASNEALSAERVELIDAIETLRVTQTELEGGVRELEARHAQASEALAEREAQLGELQQMRGSYEGLIEDLESEVQAGQIQIERLRDGLRLNLSNEILFASGSAALNEGGREVLSRVAARLTELRDRVEVQGHTDDVPIARGPFKSNWELAGARAAGVVRWLESQGVGPKRLSGVSFGEFHPVAPNDSPEGRARNRRIEVRLLPDRAPSGEAPPADRE
ncbi:MAG: OmpA family protein [Myxococcota bacterium]